MKDSIVDIVRLRYEAGKKGKNAVGQAGGNIEALLNCGTESQNSRSGTGEVLPVNLALVAIEKLCALASDTPIDMIVSPSIPNYDIDAQIYQQITRHVKERNHDDEIRPQMQKYSLVLGTGVYKVWYDDEKKTIKYKPIDACNIVVDPLARNTEEIRYIIQLAEYTKDEIYAKWGKKVDDVGVEDDNADKSAFNDGEGDQDKEVITVYEAWMKDDPKKYPNGRYVVCANDTVLVDEKNEYECGFPYVFIPCVQVADRIFGVDMFTPIREIAKEYNSLMSRSAQIIKLTGNPQVFYNPRNVDGQAISNEDGICVPVNGNPAESVWYYTPSGLSPQIIEFTKYLEYLMNVIIGANDITPPVGGSIQGLPSGRALEEFQQNTQTRLREFVRNIKRGYRELGEKIIAIAHQYLDDETVVKISGMELEEVKKVLNRDEMERLNDLLQNGAKTEDELSTGIDIANAEKGLKLRKDSGNEMYLGFKGTRLGDPNDFMVDVKGGVDVPKGKMDIAQRAEMLFASGNMDLQTYLEAIDFPLKQKVLERSPMWQQFKQFQMMQAQMAEEQAKMAKKGGRDASQGDVPIADTERGLEPEQPIV